MARVALCPQCNNDLFIGDEADPSAWAKCPECRAFFQIKDAPAREVSRAILVDHDISAAGDDTLGAGNEPQSAAETAWTPLETASAETRSTFSDSLIQTISDVESATATAEQNSAAPGARDGGITEPVPEAAADTYATLERSPTTLTDVAAMATGHAGPPSESHPQTAAGQADNDPAKTTLVPATLREAVPLEKPTAETLEDSAERIDKWFRSAKMTADSPPTVASIAPDLLATQAGDETPAALPNDANIRSTPAPELAELKTEIKLEDRPVLHENGATWEDHERMERLLADIEGDPARESDHEPPGPQETMANSQDQTKTETQWSTEISPTLSIGSGGKPRRKRSALRSFAMNTFAGMLGVAAGYYVLLWIIGPSADFFGIAQHLPAAVLPAEFQLPVSQLAGTNLPASVPDDRAEEIQASFNEPLASQNESSSAEDQDAPTTESDDLAAEPSQFDVQEAAPLTAAASGPEVPAVREAPTFTADELAVALAAAPKARSALVEGDLDDSREVQRAKGFGYSLLCDLAQKLAFVDKTSRADYVAPLEKEAEAIFRATLADQHTREEVARIVPKWIASPNRKHGGVFFAGTPLSGVDKGSVVECRVDLGGGAALSVLVPQARADRLTESARPVAVVGWIVDRPAAQVAGYTGAAPQAIWVSRLIPLD